jgi:hypothetical protein
VGVDIPSQGTIMDPSGVYRCSNYLVCLTSDYGKRFHSVFCEPGQMGTVCVFLIYANRFNFRNLYVCMIFIAVLFSLSLAGYILIFIAAILYFSYSKRSIMRVFCYSFLLILLLYNIVVVYNDGDNLVNYYLFNRLEFDESKIIAGNNRFSVRFEDFYSGLTFNDLLWGIGPDKYISIANSERFISAGYKVFFAAHGIISAILYLSFYWMVIKYHNNTYFGYVFLFIFMLAFLQRAYPFWASWLIPLIVSTPFFTDNKLSKR